MTSEEVVEPETVPGVNINRTHAQGGIAAWRFPTGGNEKND
jgi:hypothetical protein